MDAQLIFKSDSTFGCGAMMISEFGSWGRGEWNTSPTKKNIDALLDAPVTRNGYYSTSIGGDLTLRKWRDEYPYRTLSIAVTAPRQNGKAIDEVMIKLGFTKMKQGQNPYHGHPFDGKEGVTLWMIPPITKKESQKRLNKYGDKFFDNEDAGEDDWDDEEYNDDEDGV